MLELRALFKSAEPGDISQAIEKYDYPRSPPGRYFRPRHGVDLLGRINLTG